MKNLLLTLSLVVASLFSLSAAEVPAFIRNATAEAFVLDLSSWKSNTIEVSIRDSKGVTLFTEQVATGNRIRKYNVGGLSYGDYVVSVEDDSKVSTQKINVTYNSVVVTKEVNHEYKPLLVKKDDVLSLNYLALGKAFELSIIDLDYNTVYSKKFENEAAVNMNFGLAPMKSGKYTAIVQVSNKSYTYDFIK